MQVLMIDASNCPECDSKRIKFNSKNAELFCQDCGYILQEQIPVIEATSGKVEKVYVNPRQKKIAVIIRGILKTPVEKKMTPFYAELKKVSLPKHIEAEVILMARRCVEEKLTMSYPKVNILAALIFLVSKREGIPVITGELTRIFGCGKTDLFRTTKFLSKRLGIKKTDVGIESYVIRATTNLCHEELAQKAISIAVNLKIGNPVVKTAVAVWLAAKEMKIRIKKKDLAKICGISRISLRRNIIKSI